MVLECACRAAQRWSGTHANPREQAVVLRLRGNGFILAKDYSSAIAAYEEAVTVCRSIAPENIDVGLALESLANARRLSGDFAQASTNYQEALRIARNCLNNQCIATFTGNIADLHLDQYNWTGAEALAREALPLSENLGRHELIATNCRRLAKALVRQGKADEAVAYARRAVEIFTRLRSPYLKFAQATLAECLASV